jgi:drug/metabolite transporter (DMT)-like permease
LFNVMPMSINRVIDSGATAFSHSLALMPAGRASLIASINPAVTLMVAAALMGERLSTTRWLGVGVGLALVAVRELPTLQASAFTAEV